MHPQTAKAAMGNRRWILIATAVLVCVVSPVTCFAPSPSLLSRTGAIPPAFLRTATVKATWAQATRQARLRGGVAAMQASSPSVGELKEAMEKAITAVSSATLAARAVLSTLSESMEEGTVGKADTSPVTVGDFAVQALVCKTISEAFPEDGIIAEESAEVLREEASSELLSKVVAAVATAEPGATGEQVCDWIDRGSLREHRKRYWTLDPIDGTKGFLRREQFAICLALVVEGNPVAAAMACPNLPLSFDAPSSAPPGVVFCAHKGGGAWMLALPPGDEQSAAAARQALSLKPKVRCPRLRSDLEAMRACWRQGSLTVQRAQGQEQMRFCESVEAGHSDHATAAKIAATLKVTAPPLRLDSQVKYGVIARGEAEIYLRLPNKVKTEGTLIDAEYVENIWDHAAGTVLIREAGGVVTDMHGRPLDFGHGAKLIRNKGVVASYTPDLHREVIEAVGEHTAFSSPAGWGQGGGHEL